MKISYTQFGQTRLVEAEFVNMQEDEQYDEILWTERPEDYYALLSPQLKNKKVVIITRKAWLRAE